MTRGDFPLHTEWWESNDDGSDEGSDDDNDDEWQESYMKEERERNEIENHHPESENAKM